MKQRDIATKILLCAALLVPVRDAGAQGEAVEARPGSALETAAASLQTELRSSVEELDRLRASLADEKIPMARELDDLESELMRMRSEYQRVSRDFDSRTLSLSNLTTDIKRLTDERTYVTGLLSDYLRNFESRLHIAELALYREPLETAKLAVENKELSTEDLYHAQTALLSASLERLENALGGHRFEGSAVDPNGLVTKGAFLLVGPAALFRSADGGHVGTAEQRLGSLEPALIEFVDEKDTEAALRLVASGNGTFPLDTTLGNAHKIARTQDETFLDEVDRGGPVMYPIFGMAGAALLVAILKWLGMAFVRKPSPRRISALLNALDEGDEDGAREKARTIRGPTGRMLAAGIEHMREPTELIEEVMYETVLTTRLKLQRFLPFIAICAASAPLLGLLGTVTGIIQTFKLITVFGSGDVKMLSGGISEALITTKYGLIVAIPSLLIHAFLSRKAKGIVGQMEITAVSFVNQISKNNIGREIRPVGRAQLTSVPASGGPMTDPEQVRKQVNEILTGMLEPLMKENGHVPAPDAVKPR